MSRYPLITLFYNISLKNKYRFQLLIPTYWLLHECSMNNKPLRRLHQVTSHKSRHIKNKLYMFTPPSWYFIEVVTDDTALKMRFLWRYHVQDAHSSIPNRILNYLPTANWTKRTPRLNEKQKPNWITVISSLLGFISRS